MGHVRSLQSFRPVQTQTMLYSRRRQIEALNLGSSGIVLSADDLCLCFAYAKSRFSHDAAHMREKESNHFVSLNMKRMTAGMFSSVQYYGP